MACGCIEQRREALRQEFGNERPGGRPADGWAGHHLEHLKAPQPVDHHELSHLLVIGCCDGVMQILPLLVDLQQHKISCLDVKNLLMPNVWVGQAAVTGWDCFITNST